ncbi:MAG: serine/threonine protein kinase [Pirellulaceae bacterium]
MTPERYARIKELFLAAVELDEPRRAEFLDERCGGDPKLRADVQDLLDHHSPRTIIPADKQYQVDTVKARETQPDAVRKRTVSRSMRVPVLGPKGQLAVGVAIAGLLLTLFGIWQRANVHHAIKTTLRERMVALMDGHVESFENWAGFQRRMVEYWAQDPSFKSYVESLLRLDNGDAEDYSNRLRLAEEQQGIRRELRAAGGQHTQYVVLDMEQRVIAEGPEKGSGLGKLISSSASSRLSPVFRGQTIMFVDDVSDIIHADYPAVTDVTDVFVAAPIRNAQGEVIAVVTLFNVETAVMENSIRSTSKITDTSEMFAFNDAGLMLSESRFNDELRRVGLLDSDENVRSSLNVVLRDPGGDMTAGFQPTKTLLSRPLTHMARHAIAGETGSDLDGYRNYLGQTVVGVWRWLPQYEIGFAMEMSYEEAYQALRYVGRQFLLSFGLLTASVLGIVLSAIWISRLRRQIGSDRQLGQYTLGELIGEGGMGRVFRANHSLLKRPCAVKVLKPELSDPRHLDWFEREVQAVSKLSHPNTIRIFDFGSTPEGNFYYSMEYLRGIDLEELVIRHGPIPWKRAVFLLRQICRSLREAHSMGMVHRDIKPQNIMLCLLGGEADFVKVLDFGLARPIHPDSQDLTKTKTLAGTPLYMAPERWREPGEDDPRSDIYSIGAVVYRLLTGREIYTAKTPAALVEQIVAGEIKPLAECGVPDLPSELEYLVMSCLASDVDSRPSSVDEILKELEQLPKDDFWNESMALQWWHLHEPQGDMAVK